MIVALPGLFSYLFYKGILIFITHLLLNLYDKSYCNCPGKIHDMSVNL